MRTVIARALFAVLGLCCVVAQPASAQPAVAASHLITGGVPIRNSVSDSRNVFHETAIFAPLAPGQRAFISSDPDGTGPIIVDNELVVNGRRYVGFSGTLTDPRRHLGASAVTAYTAVEPIEVTADARGDGWWNIALSDHGYTLTSSRLYLVIR